MFKATLKLTDLKMLIDLSNEYDIEPIKKSVEAEITILCHKNIQIYQKKYSCKEPLFKEILQLLVIADYGNFEYATTLCTEHIGKQCSDYGPTYSSKVPAAQKHMDENKVSVRTKARLMGQIIEKDSEKLCSDCRSTKSELKLIANYLQNLK